MNMVTSSEPPTSQVYDININSYSPSDLRNLCTKLESMTKLNQVEVLRIFHKYNKELINENNYGIHINITDIEDYVLQEIEEYIKYVMKQIKNYNYKLSMDTIKQNIKNKNSLLLMISP